jgi:hypothetical protein
VRAQRVEAKQREDEHDMPQTAIFGPFLAMMLLTLGVWVFLFVRRIPFIRANPETLTDPTLLARIAPPAVAMPSDNLKNLFELPVLFYALALYLFATSRVDATYVTAAWIFFAFRALHSAIHCTFNNITLRFSVYLVAALALWCMVLRVALSHFGA